MTGYELSRNWFDWAFENPDLNTPTHTALYLWYVEKWNRCGQKEKISITTSESMEVLGISSRNTFSKVFKDLCAWNFIKIIVESKNQYSCNIISLAQNIGKHEDSTVASTRTALSQALIQHGSKHEDSTVASTDTINKQRNKETSKQVNKESKEEISKEILPSDILENILPISIEEQKKEKLPPVPLPPPLKKNVPNSPYGDGELHQLCRDYENAETKYSPEIYKAFLTHWTAIVQNGTKKEIGQELWRTQKTFQLSGRLSTWYQNDLKFSKHGTNNANQKSLGATAVFPKNVDYSGKLGIAR